MAGSNRARVLAGLADAVEAKGFAAVTIADIARAAGMSKRTFYEEFSDKETCFVAFYTNESERCIALLREAAARDCSWSDRVHTVVRTYLSALRQRPALTRACFLELYAAGPTALVARRKVLENYASFLRQIVQVSRAQTPALRELSPAMALALVAGINELVLLTLEQDRSAHLLELEDTASAMVVGLTER